MSAADPPREFATQVVEKLVSAGYEALWAGGCVRDLLLGRTPKDYDVATNARPEQVRELFGNRRTLAVGASFGVMIVVGRREAGNVEVATFRTEGPYADGRRPDHVTFATAEQDAQRRDFTINGMFYDPLEQQILDYVGGERDLAAGLVRAIGNPHDRMREDKLRMLRAVRFTANMDFQLDPTTADAVRQLAPEISVVSVERIAQELRRMLADPHRSRAMQLCHDVSLLPQILPELSPLLATDEPAPPDTAPPMGDWQRTLHMLQLAGDTGFEPALAILLHSLEDADGASALCRRLKLSNNELKHVAWLIEHQHDLDDAPTLSLARLKTLLGHPLAGDLLTLARLRHIAHNRDPGPILFCENFLRTTPPEELDPEPLISGDDLRKSGLRPGPRFKAILDAVREAQLNNAISTAEEALQLAAELDRP